MNTDILMDHFYGSKRKSRYDNVSNSHLKKWQKIVYLLLPHAHAIRKRDYFEHDFDFKSLPSLLE